MLSPCCRKIILSKSCEKEGGEGRGRVGKGGAGRSGVRTRSGQGWGRNGVVVKARSEVSCKCGRRATQRMSGRSRSSTSGTCSGSGGVCGGCGR